MADEAKLNQSERFTMLEAREPNNPLSGSESWPITDLRFQERFTMLEARGPNNPLPGSESWPLVEIEVSEQFAEVPKPTNHATCAPLNEVEKKAG